MHLSMAMVGAGKKGFIVTLAAQGVSRQNALALAHRFMSEIRPGKEAVSKETVPKETAQKGPS